MRALGLHGLVFVSMLCSAGAGCATAEDLSGTPVKTDGSAQADGLVDDDTGGGDASVDDSTASDTNTDPDTGSDTSVADTSLPPDTAVPDTGPADTGAPDTGPDDTGAPDTGTVTDTGTPVTCAPSGEYGPKCKTNADCALMPGSCGYVCCAFDPLLGLNLGCGRIAFGGSCLP